MRANHAKRRLAAGEPSIGTWLSLPSPEAAEYIAENDDQLLGKRPAGLDDTHVTT